MAPVTSNLIDKFTRLDYISGHYVFETIPGSMKPNQNNIIQNYHWPIAEIKRSNSLMIPVRQVSVFPHLQGSLLFVLKSLSL